MEKSEKKNISHRICGHYFQIANKNEKALQKYAFFQTTLFKKILQYIRNFDRNIKRKKVCIVSLH